MGEGWVFGRGGYLGDGGNAHCLKASENTNLLFGRKQTSGNGLSDFVCDLVLGSG